MKEILEIVMEQILQGNVENINLEFKSSFDFNTNDWAKERLIRSILAMSNTRNGGFIVIGIKEENNKSYSYEGLNNNHLLLFKSKMEDLKSQIESFSSSSVNYEIGLGKYRNKDFILISVTEFFLNPVICNKNGKHKDKHLEEGAIYIRTLKDKPSSVKLVNPIDIQDFLERVVDKQILNLNKRGWKHEITNMDNTKLLFQKERNNF